MHHILLTSCAAALSLAVVASHAGMRAQEPVERPRITGTAHIAFRASNFAAAREFYGRVLGLAEDAGNTPQRLSY